MGYQQGGHLPSKSVDQEWEKWAGAHYSGKAGFLVYSVYIGTKATSVYGNKGLAATPPVKLR